MSQIKELLEKIKDVLYSTSPLPMKALTLVDLEKDIDQALAKLRTEPEESPNINPAETISEYPESMPDCQAPEQPPAGEFTEKLRNFVKMYEKEVPRRAEITFLKEACTIIDRSDERNKQLKMLNTIFLTNSQEKEEQLKVQFDRSEASRTALLTALKELAATFVGLTEGSIGGQAMKKANDAIAKEKEVKK